MGAAGGAGRAAGGWGPARTSHFLCRVFSLNTTMVLRQAKSCLFPGGSEKAFGAAEILKYPEAPWKSPAVSVTAAGRKFSSACLLPAIASGRESVWLNFLKLCILLVPSDPPGGAASRAASPLAI